MGGIAKAKGAIPYIVNGVRDHVHLLTSLPANIELERFVGQIKGSSSRWVTKRFERHFAWQRAYSAFSVSRSNVERVRRYVEMQQEHHKRVSFRDELAELLRKHGIDHDQRWIGQGGFE